MRISDWSSDVCSSDLIIERMIHRQHQARLTERLRLRQATAWAGGGCRKRILPIDFRTGPAGARHVQRRHGGDKIVAHTSLGHLRRIEEGIIFIPCMANKIGRASSRERGWQYG